MGWRSWRKRTCTKIQGLGATWEFGLSFRDVYFLRMQITERFNPLDFGFAYGDRSFSCKAVVISFSKSHIKLSFTKRG